MQMIPRLPVALSGARERRLGLGISVRASMCPVNPQRDEGGGAAVRPAPRGTCTIAEAITMVWNGGRVTVPCPGAGTGAQDRFPALIFCFRFRDSQESSGSCDSRRARVDGVSFPQVQQH